MTQKGKCDVCRKRKIKTRPVCLRCAKQDWACTYAYGKVTDYLFIDENNHTGQRHRDPNIHRFELCTDTTTSSPDETCINSFLSEKLCAPSKHGIGVFQTFSSTGLEQVIAKKSVSSRLQPTSTCKRRSKSPIYQPYGMPRNLESTHTKLAAQFVSLLGLGEPASNPNILWGAWVNLIPSRLGSNPVLDRAAECFIAGLQAYLTRTEQSVNDAQLKYVKALRCLHMSVDQGGARQRSEVLSAVQMFSIFEIFMGMHTNAWVTHARGFFKMMTARGAKAHRDELDRGVYYSSYWQEVSDAILNDKLSDFDDPEWLNLPPLPSTAKCPGIEDATHLVMQNFVRIPRLMKIIRTLRRDPSNTAIAAEAIELAEALFADDLENWVSEILFDAIVPTQSPELASLSPESLTFQSCQVFEVLTRYWACQIFLCGLIQTLVKLTPLASIFDLNRVIAQEIRAAEYIVMSSDYALELSSFHQIPVGAMIMIIPLQVAFGAWYREEKRGEERGSIMKRWVLRRSNATLRLWRGKDLGETELERKSDAFAGDDILPWMRRTIKH